VNQYGKWELINELGEGGQGRVYLAKDTEKTGGTEHRLKEIKDAISSLASAQTHETQMKMGQLVAEALSYVIPKDIDPSAIGAIKVLHEPPKKQGYEKAKEFVIKHLLGRIEEIVSKKLWQDAKSYVQEKAQEHLGVTPSYKVLKETGPDHDKHFVIGIYFGDDLVAEGKGKSKQEGEQKAAQKALQIKKWQEE